MTDLLNNNLYTEVESSQTYPAEDRGTHKGRRGEDGAILQCPKGRYPRYQADRLPTGQPDTGSYGTNASHQPRREPCGQDLEGHRESPREANLGGIVTR